MREFDFSPLFRTGVGFDRMTQLLDAMASENASGYPPYNIEKLDDNGYRITMAVAGFTPDELDVTVKENGLTVSANTKQEGEEKTYLHHGIAGRSFERRFELADFIKVEGAKLENGLLHVDLIRQVPEEKKPRKVAIATDNQPQVIEQKAA